jgi:hypothetical protein
MRYSETVDPKEKAKIWNLYFYKMFTYEDLRKYFNEKYTYAQLKSIIIEGLEIAIKQRKEASDKYGNANKISK